MTISEIDSLRTKFITNPKPKLFDFGSQDVFIGSEDDLDQISSIISNTRNDPQQFREIVSGKFGTNYKAADVFENMGYEYHCSDIDGRDGTIYLDFNAMPDFSHLHGQFDFVINSGTTEHVLSSPGAFFYMHNLAKTGGILYNYVPVFGFGNHGIINHTPKFWHTLEWMNQYELLEGRLQYADEALVDSGNFFHDYLGKFKGLADIKDISHMIQVVFRKNKDTAFIPPIDPVIDPTENGQALGKIVAGSLRPYVLMGLMEPEEALNATNSFLEYNAKPFRFNLDGTGEQSWFKQSFKELNVSLKRSWLGTLWNN